MQDAGFQTNGQFGSLDIGTPYLNGANFISELIIGVIRVRGTQR